jgi:hypothetical protein
VGAADLESVLDVLLVEGRVSQAEQIAALLVEEPVPDLRMTMSGCGSSDTTQSIGCPALRSSEAV